MYVSMCLPDAGVVDLVEADDDGVSDTGLVHGHDLSSLVKPVGLWAHDLDRGTTLGSHLKGGREGKGRGKGRQRRSAEGCMDK